MEATFVMVESVLFFEKFPNTYPNMKTILVINNILVKINKTGIIVNFRFKKNSNCTGTFLLFPISEPKLITAFLYSIAE